VRRVAFDLRFFETSADTVSFLGDPAGDAWVLSVSYGLPFAN
jgi:hypothetical protein